MRTLEKNSTFFAKVSSFCRIRLCKYKMTTYQADVDIDGGHLHEDELKECEAGVVEDWVEPPVQVGRVTHFGSVTDDEIVFSSKYDFDHHFLPVRVEDKGDEEGDVEGGHAHPGPVVLCKNVLELDNHDGEHTSMMGRMYNER